MTEAIEERGILDKVVIDNDSPVQAPLKKLMKIEVAVNEKGQVWVCHDKPLPNSLDWIEYDLETDRLIFVGRGGKIHDYGEEILPEVRTYLKKATSAYVVYMKNKKIEDMGEIKLVVRQRLH